MSGDSRLTLNVLATITLAWLIATLILVFTHAPTWKIKIGVVGLILGLIGLLYSYRRLKRESTI